MVTLLCGKSIGKDRRRSTSVNFRGPCPGGGRAFPARSNEPCPLLVLRCRPVKSVRILLLLLLVVVLPFRGVLAQVVHCAGNANEIAQVAGTAHVHEGGHHHGDEGHHAHPDHDAQGAVDDASGPSATTVDPCNLCAASCASPPILMAPPALVPSPLVTASAYPALDAPPPSHLSEAQERPPRSL